MPLDWETGDLAEGLRCYREQRYFDAHEHWEDVWRSWQGPEKSFLQALIQIAVAMHHAQQGNRVGASSLLGRALHRLEGLPVVYAGVEVEPLRASLRAWSIALEQESASTPAPPSIR
jgi:uncharacterized protein